MANSGPTRLGCLPSPLPSTRKEKETLVQAYYTDVITNFSAHLLIHLFIHRRKKSWIETFLKHGSSWSVIVENNLFSKGISLFPFRSKRLQMRRIHSYVRLSMSEICSDSFLGWNALHGQNPDHVCCRGVFGFLVVTWSKRLDGFVVAFCQSFATNSLHHHNDDLAFFSLHKHKAVELVVEMLQDSHGYATIVASTQM